MKNSLPYMPRLDGLRAVAVFGVLVEHWIPNFAIRSVNPGGAGVTLFFVLSGYLITRILMDYRDWDISVAAGHFYWCRLLRLSPPLYAAHSRRCRPKCPADAELLVGERAIPH